MIKLSNILYKIKNILFILFLIGSIKIIPSIYEQGILGIILLTTIIIYTIIMLFCFLKKNQFLNNNLLNNILGILLSLYVFMISIKYTQSLGLEIQNLYFVINYIVIIFAMISMIIVNLMLLDYGEKKQG